MSKKTEYVEWWLNGAEEELTENSSSTLWHFVTENISGGKSGWEPEIEEVFSKPADLEEMLLRLRICFILEIALGNSIQAAERRMKRDRLGPPCCPWNAMDIGYAFSLAGRIATYNPLCAVRAKIQLNILCGQLGETLFSISNSPYGISPYADVGISW